MRHIISTLLLCLFFVAGFSQKKSAVYTTPDKNKPMLSIEVACGKCQMGLPGKDCELAARVNGKAHYIDGAHIDSLGDAHAKDGFCNTIRNAQVQGELVNNRFKVSYIALEPAKKE